MAQINLCVFILTHKHGICARRNASRKARGQVGHVNQLLQVVSAICDICALLFSFSDCMLRFCIALGRSWEDMQQEEEETEFQTDVQEVTDYVESDFDEGNLEGFKACREL